MEMVEILSQMHSVEFSIAMWSINTRVSDAYDDVFVGAVMPMLKEMSSCKKSLPQMYSGVCFIHPTLGKSSREPTSSDTLVNYRR